MAGSQRMAHHKQSISNILSALGDGFPLNSKLVHLWKVTDVNAACLIKIILENNDLVFGVLSQFNPDMISSSTILDGLLLARDKILLERKLLRPCHVEFDDRTKNSEHCLRIIIINGMPKVGPDI